MKDWERLANLLVARARQHADGAPRTQMLLRAANVLLVDAGRPEAALDAIELARSANPDDVDVLLSWARIQVALGRANHALIMLYEAAERLQGKKTPALASIHLAIGKAHLAVDEVVEAFDALETAFAIDWRTEDLAMLLGLVAVDLADERAAERAFSAVTTLPPRKGAAGPGADAATKAVAYHHLASLALSRGDLAKARRLAAKALSADAGHAGARALLERIEPSVPAAAAAPGGVDK